MSEPATLWMPDPETAHLETLEILTNLLKSSSLHALRPAHRSCYLRISWAFLVLFPDSPSHGQVALARLRVQAGLQPL